MKKGIHPEYNPARIVCSCGNVIETRSTVGDMSVEICAVCHPFYTGKQRLVDTAGRVERFKRKYGSGAEAEPEAEAESGAAVESEVEAESRAESESEVAS